jgi:hypothetical protein
LKLIPLPDQRLDDIGEGIDDVEDRLLKLSVHGVDRFESVVPEDLLADFISKIFLRIELRRIGWQEEQRDIVGHHSGRGKR